MSPLAAKLRGTALVVYFLVSSIGVYLSTVTGYPLWLVSRNLARAWIGAGKRLFAIVQVTVLQFFTNSNMHLYIDDEIKDQFKIDEKTGNLKSNISPRSVFISNHQLYSDWIYLWWLAYTSDLSHAIKIVLKHSLKYIPIFGWGMQHFEFLFLKRKWADDQHTIANQMTEIAQNPSLPVFIILFPEGTTMSKGGYSRNHAYAQKNGIKEFNNVLLPRVRGLQAVVKGGQLPYIYDVTIYYSGIPEGTYGEEYYTLGRTYAGGQSPPDIRMHIRRIDTKNIPYEDSEELNKWLFKLWGEKDEIFEQLKTGSIPGEPLETKARLKSVWQVLEPFNVPLMFGVGARLLYKWWTASRS